MMMFKAVSPWIAAAVLMLVAALGASLWVLRPEEADVWAVSMFFLPLAWCALALAKRSRIGRHLEKDGLGYTGALTVAGIIVAASLGFTLAESLELVGEGATSRGMGVVMGWLLVVVGNAMPKILEPLERMRCDPSRVQALKRFSGWTFVLAGIAYAATWLVLPLEPAAFASGLVASAAVVLVAARLGWMYLRRWVAAGPARG